MARDRTRTVRARGTQGPEPEERLRLAPRDGPSEQIFERVRQRRVGLGSMATAGGVVLGVVAAGILWARRERSPTKPSTRAAEKRHLRRMIAHLETGAALARLAAEKGEEKPLRTLGHRMHRATEARLDTLRTLWRRGHGDEVPRLLPNEALAMAGMPPPGEVERLERLSGRRFDNAILQVLIAYHKGAIRLAEAVRSDGVRMRVQRQARAIGRTRRKQVDILERLLIGVRPVEEAGPKIVVTERLHSARGRTPKRTLTGRILDATRKLPVLLASVRRPAVPPRDAAGLRPR